MTWIIGKLQAYLAAIGVALAVVAGAFLYGRSAGKADAKADQANANAKAVKRARGVENEINGIGDGDVDARLNKWCATVGGSYCDVARPVRPSVDDQMTADTKRQILAENSKIEKLCGVRP